MALTEDRGVRVYRVGGDLNEQAASELRRTVSRMLPTEALVVDLFLAHEVDGSGFAALLGVISDIRHGGGRVAVAARRPLARQLRFVGLDRVAPIAHTPREAVAWLVAR